jgi:hypothetical protein
VPAEPEAASYDVILAIDQITFFACAGSESAGSQGEQADGECCTQYEFHVWSRMKEFIPRNLRVAQSAAGGLLAFNANWSSF